MAYPYIINVKVEPKTVKPVDPVDPAVPKDPEVRPDDPKPSPDENPENDQIALTKFANAFA